MTFDKEFTRFRCVDKNMNDKITQTVEKYHMLANGDTVLIALSGGADSVFWLNICFPLKKI